MAQQQKGGALARRFTDDQLARVSGSHRDPGRLNEILGWASQSAHLVAPATSAGAIPEGTSVAVSVVHLDARGMDKGGEVYETSGGKWALGKSALDRIAQAAGVSWDPHLSRRLDDGSDPRYCHFRAVGTVRLFDGTEIVITGEKEMDLRDNSPQVRAMQARSKSGDITKQRREMELHILAHAESKAKNRAIRSLGLKSGFTRDDLSRPFVVARLMWTGQSDDPVLRQRFAEMTAATFLSSSRAIYGPQPMPQLGASPPVEHHAPPPVGAVGADPEDLPPPAGPRGALPAPADDPPPPPPPRSQPQQQAARPPDDGDPYVIPGGQEKGTPIAEASNGTLEYWSKRIASDLERGETKDRFVEHDTELVRRMRAELEARGAAGPADEPPPGDDGDRY